MQRLVSATMFVTCLVAIPAVVRAQDCSSVNSLDIRGTYTMSGGGYIDLSRFLAGIPGLPPLPTGLIPMNWVGVTTFDGTGGGGGWISFNAGGAVAWHRARRRRLVARARPPRRPIMRHWSMVLLWNGLPNSRFMAPRFIDRVAANFKRHLALPRRFTRSEGDNKQGRREFSVCL